MKKAEVKESKMKEQLIETIIRLRENGHNLQEAPALFRWAYPEFPEIEIQMLIREIEDYEVPEDVVLH